MRLSLDSPQWLMLGAVLLPIWFVAGRATLADRRGRLSFLLRVLVVLALALAAAGPSWLRPARRLAVSFVLDRSASLSEAARARALAFVQTALREAEGRAEAGVVVTADGAAVERSPGERSALAAITADVGPHQSDLAAGLRLGEALLPSDCTRRIVLLTDGEETRGDARTQAASASDDVEIFTVPLPRGATDEVLLDGLSAPARVDEGASFDLRLVARADRPVNGRVHLYRNDRLIGSFPVHLAGGAELLSIPETARETGYLRYRAVLDVDGGDPLPQNNVAVATVAVRGRPRVLVVEASPGADRWLAETLRADGLQVDAVGPDAVPGALPALAAYGVVLLSNVPAYALTTRQMDALLRFVRDLGRGLAMLGGSESFGLGGYYRTPVEEALPVRMDITDKRLFPSLAMVLAIDRSGSMGGSGRAEKLGMAKEAAIQTADLMSERDRLGVVSFDAAASWAVPLTELSQRASVRSAIARLQSGGGTDIYPALAEAYKALVPADAAMKHIVLLSDGVSMGGDFETLIRLGTRRGVTLSAVAIGDDADRNSMETWARWGAGRYYLVTAPEHIPRIFTREMMMSTRSFLVEQPFVPALAAPDPITKGLPAPLPPLAGYVATEVKERAKTLLVAQADKKTPLLATWRHGLGRSAAWTSDARPVWAAAWIGTEAYRNAWVQIVRWLGGDAGSADLVATAEHNRGTIELSIDAFTADGSFRNFLDGEARFVAPDLTVVTRPLRQVAPGRYVASAPASQDGSYVAAAFLRDRDGNEVGTATGEASIPYSPEYRPLPGGDALVADVARIGRGEQLEADREDVWDRIFAPPDRPRLVPHPLGRPLLSFAGLLWLLDIAVRRLAWPLFVGRAIVAETPRSDRVRGGSSTPARPPAPPRLRTAGEPAPPRAVPSAEPPEPEPEPETSSEPPPEPTRNEQYVGGLLNARKRARKGRES